MELYLCVPMSGPVIFRRFAAVPSAILVRRANIN